MLDDINDLYQELILDHNSNPHNFGELECATHHAKGHNPLCGDDVEVFLVIENGIVKDVNFTGQGCAISKSSASIMTDEVKGKSLIELKNIFESFHNLLTDEKTDLRVVNNLGKAGVFAGVKQYPMRVKCATLCWHTLVAATESNLENPVVTTE